MRTTELERESVRSDLEHGLQKTNSKSERRVKGLPAKWAMMIGILLACSADASDQFAPSSQEKSRASQSVGQSDDEEQAPSGFFEIVFSGGVIGITIMVLLISLSVGMVALIVEHLLTIRREVLI